MATHTIEKFVMDPTTGEISDEVTKHYAPSVLPMDRLEVRGRLLVMVAKTGRGLKKGDLYSVDYIHRTGMLVIRSRKGFLQPGLYPMELFAEMLEVAAPAPKKP